MSYITPEIISCGYFNCEEKFGNLKKSPQRVSKGIEIEMFLEDGLSTYLNGRELKIQKNNIVVVKEGSLRYSLLPFKTVFLKISACGDLLELLNSLPDYFPSVRTEQILDILNEIILLNDEKVKNRLLIGSKILQLIDLLIKDVNYSSGESGAYLIMHKSKKFIEQNYHKRISTADIAAFVNLSESRFRFLFGQSYGISPHQYLVNVRISRAKQMLWAGDIPLDEIAEKCGFGCQQYFSEIFKRETGLSPKKYKLSLAERYNNI